MGRKLNNIRTMVYPEALRPSLGFGLGSANKDERHGTNTMPNNRTGGSVLPHYLKMEMWQALDLHYFLCPTWRRFGASVLLEDSQVMSAPLRPSCALTLNEHTMRSLPLGTKSNVTRAQRCAKYRRLKTIITRAKKKTRAAVVAAQNHGLINK